MTIVLRCMLQEIRINCWQIQVCGKSWVFRVFFIKVQKLHKCGKKSVFQRRAVFFLSCRLTYCIKLNGKLIVNKEPWWSFSFVSYKLINFLMTVIWLTSIVIFQRAFFPNRFVFYFVFHLHRRLSKCYKKNFIWWMNPSCLPTWNPCNYIFIVHVLVCISTRRKYTYLQILWNPDIKRIQECTSGHNFLCRLYTKLWKLSYPQLTIELISSR